jgi:glucose-1-phosphatase
MMEIDFSGVRNLVFDLGGVLYAIDPPRTVAALTALAGPRARHMAMDDPLFLALETGSIAPHDFRQQLRLAIDTTASDAALDHAWNALLLGPIDGRLAWLRQLAQHYRILLLSNTNVIHQGIWGPECAEMFACMEVTFFSFEMGLRKPGTEIYHRVAATMGIQASETLFLDDSPANLLGAAQAGWQTLLIDPLCKDDFDQFCLKALFKV